MLKSNSKQITSISKILAVLLAHSFEYKEGRKYIMYNISYIENDHLNGLKSIYGEFSSNYASFKCYLRACTKHYGINTKT